jgi:hypothetical protein
MPENSEYLVYVIKWFLTKYSNCIPGIKIIMVSFVVLFRSVFGWWHRDTLFFLEKPLL